MLVAVPTGIKIFNWLGTMYGGKIRFELPMLFCLGFLFQFLIAGLTGVMLGVAPFNWQLTDSYFVVAHFHYTLVGGFLFTIFAAIYYWYPKATGRMLNQKLGLWHFWLFLIGFHLTFDPQHIAGILGMPRRIYTYDAGRGWEIYNLISSLGAVFQAAGLLCLVANLPYRCATASGRAMIRGTRGRSNGPRPRRRRNTTLKALPEVRSRRPLWDLKHPEDPDWKYE